MLELLSMKVNRVWFFPFRVKRGPMFAARLPATSAGAVVNADWQGHPCSAHMAHMGWFRVARSGLSGKLGCPCHSLLSCSGAGSRLETRSQISTD